jgi:hypothetical protein
VVTTTSSNEISGKRVVAAEKLVETGPMRRVFDVESRASNVAVRTSVPSS